MKHARPDYNRIQDPAGLIPSGEPVFLLRGQDPFAPYLVRTWASMAAAADCDFDIIRMALDHATAMEGWQAVHRRKDRPDLPDSSAEPQEQAKKDALGLTDVDILSQVENTMLVHSADNVLCISRHNLSRILAIAKVKRETDAP